MSTELECQLTDLAAAWEHQAPPIHMREVRVRARTSSRLVDAELSSGMLVVTEQRMPHRWPKLFLVTAVAATTVALVAVLVRDPKSHSVIPTDSGLVSTSQQPATTAGPPSTTATVPDTQAAQLAEVTGIVSERLSALQSFRATATRRDSEHPVDDPTAVDPNEATSVNTITLMGGGSLWIEGDLAQWAVYDATTGVSRMATVAADGATHYQEIVGWSDNTTPLLIVLAVDPVIRFVDLVEPTLKEVTSHLGRPAWQLTSTSKDESTPPTYVSVETFVVDQQTGLIVDYRKSEIQGGIERLTESRLTDLVANVALPPAFPGTFPEGATIERSGDPNGFDFISASDAAAQFGDGFVVPTGDGLDLRFMFDNDDSGGDILAPNVNYKWATIMWHTGFVRSLVQISKNFPHDVSLPPPASMVAVGDLLCWSLDGQHCTGYDAPSEISGGALAGMPSIYERSSLTIVNGALTVTVTAPTKAAELAIANSLATFPSG